MMYNSNQERVKRYGQVPETFEKYHLQKPDHLHLSYQQPGTVHLPRLHLVLYH